MTRTPTTITLLLLFGDPKSLRTAKISNWAGAAFAAPRAELEELLKRSELDKPGVYILSGTDPISSKPRAYIGEAENIRERLKQHKAKDFWDSAVVFVSQGDDLNKAHTRYLEGRLISEAKKIGSVTLENCQDGKPKLGESDQASMDVFLHHIRQLLPVLGSDLFVPVALQQAPSDQAPKPLVCRIKGAKAFGQRIPSGFVVFKGSTAVPKDRPAAQSALVEQRRKLVADGTLVEQDGFYLFTKDTKFSSPSAAASVIHGGGANGLIEWRTEVEPASTNSPSGR